MATILFLMRYSLDHPDNFTTKFNGQLAGMRALGHTALCVGVRGGEMCLMEGDKVTPLQKNRFSTLPGYRHTKLYWDLMSAARRVISSRRVDAVYLRYKPLSPNVMGMAKLNRQKGGKLMVEIPTYPSQKEPDHRPLRRALLALTERLLKRLSPLVDLFTLVGEHNKDGLLLGRPAINICNGVEPDLLPMRRVNTAPGEIHALLLASVSRYQAYDRLLEGMARDRAASESLFLHLVGGDVDGSVEQLKEQAERERLHLEIHGPLYGQALSDLFDRCDVGVGTLGLYRKGIDVCSVLKVREYMGRGLPFVYSGEDDMLKTPADFMRRVSNDDAPVPAAALTELALSLKGQADVPGRMRAYAKEHMSWQAVWKTVLEKVALDA